MGEIIRLVPHHIQKALETIYKGNGSFDADAVRELSTRMGYDPEWQTQKVRVLEALRDPDQEIHVLFPGCIEDDVLCGACTTVRSSHRCDETTIGIRFGLTEINVDSVSLEYLDIRPGTTLKARELINRYEARRNLFMGSPDSQLTPAEKEG